MNLQERKEALVQLGAFMGSNDAGWAAAKQKASVENAWFIPEFIELAVTNIRRLFLTEAALSEWIAGYDLTEPASPKKVGIVMAGNIPLVGFHDLLCTFLTGHYAVCKLSTKDAALPRFLMEQLAAMHPEAQPYITISEMLKGCDAYIATGSNNSAGYFDYYFSKYPHIIRRNRTSVAVLTGNETPAELENLADDVHLYFGLGCRNVTKLFVPQGYNFEALLQAFRKYHYLINHNKYKNNYDYNLAIHLLNHTYYMTNGSLLLIENASPFSPIAQLNYEFYRPGEPPADLTANEAIQCVAGAGFLPFGKTQSPGLCHYADGVDTVAFLQRLS